MGPLGLDPDCVADSSADCHPRKQACEFALFSLYLLLFCGPGAAETCLMSGEKLNLRVNPSLQMEKLSRLWVVLSKRRTSHLVCQY